MSADKFQHRDRYGAMNSDVAWLKEMLGLLREHHGSFTSNRDGFVSMAVSVYDIEPIGVDLTKDYLVLYQARFTAGKSGAKGADRQRKIKFHLAIISGKRIDKMKTIETPHGIIRRWIEEGKSPLSLLETKEPNAKSF